jgi:hypothetical protein
MTKNDADLLLNQMALNIFNKHNLIANYDDAYYIYEFCLEYGEDSEFNPKTFDFIDIELVVKTGNEKIVRFLVENYYYNKNKYKIYYDFDSTLEFAIFHKNIDVIDYLIKNELVDIKDTDLYYSMIDDILENDNVTVLDYLVKSNLISLNYKEGYTIEYILSEALKDLQLNIIKYLVKPNSSLRRSLALLPDSQDDKYSEYAYYILASNITIVIDVDKNGNSKSICSILGIPFELVSSL